jgi:hypothetical protein
VPLLEGRRAYPHASLEATVLNIMGGKHDPSKSDAAPPTPPHLLWLPEERLPPWARLMHAPSVWTPASARAALDHAARLPTAALARIDFHRLRAIAVA